MNEQIKTLADRAGFIRFSLEEDPDTPIDWSCDYSIELNKFAELIVEECANYAFSDDQERNAMLEHFGVEE